MKDQKPSGEELKARIRNKGYTLKAFAKVLGVSDSTLHRFLSGTQENEQLRRHVLLALQLEPFNPGMRIIPSFYEERESAMTPRLWRAIEREATAQGKTTEVFFIELMQAMAKKLAEMILQERD